MEDFNAKKVTKELILWLKEWFNKNGKNCNAIIGISGGKDSLVVAALCKEALGKDRVIGVLMPNGEQGDIEDAITICKLLDIRSITINIKDVIDTETKLLLDSIKSLEKEELSNQTMLNLPPRIRMATLYAISQSMNGRVLNTCNLSEDWVGYSTRYGDSVGDVSPISSFTVDEVRQIGLELGLPKDLVYKSPSDGLSGKTDEDNLGFTYDTLDKYIRTGICENQEIKALIDKKHFQNKFKLALMPSFKYGTIKANDEE